MKKLISGALLSVILLSSVSAFAAERYGSNMMSNPSFSTGDLSQWLQETRPQFTPNAKVEQNANGEYYVRLDANKLQDAMRLYQNNKTFYKDQVYRLHMKVKGVKEDENVSDISYITSVRLKTKNGSGTNYHTQLEYKNADVNEYVDYKMLPEDSVCTVGIFGSMDLKNCKYLHVTDVGVEPLRGIEKYDFENENVSLGQTGIIVWDGIDGASALIANEGYESEYSLKITPLNGKYRHYISFEEQKPYYISALIKTDKGNKIKLMFESPSGEESVLSEETSSGDWQELSAFKSYENLPNERGYIYWKSEKPDGSQAEYMLDNVEAMTNDDFLQNIYASFDGQNFKIKVNTSSLRNVGEVTLCDNGNNVLYTAVYDEAEGVYKFKVNDDFETGQYIIKYTIDGFSEISEDVFYYDAKLLEALQKIDSASEEKMGEYIEEYADLLNIDIEPYKEIKDEKILNKINSKLLSEDFSVNPDNLAEEIEKKAKLFCDTYNSVLVPSFIADCSDAMRLRTFAEKNKAEDAIKDEKYYSEKIDKDCFYGYMIKVRAYQDEFSLENTDYIKDLYTNTLLIYMINESDYRKIPDILKYYTQNGIINISFSKYERLTDNQKLKVLEKLQNEKIVNPKQLSVRMDALSDAALSETVVEPVKRGGSSGGGTGFSGVKVNDTQNVDDKETIGNDEINKDVIKFKDIASVPWAHEAIEKLSELGAISGRNANEFDPDAEVTREEAVKMIVGAFELKDDGLKELSFDDVDKNDWYYPYVVAAKENGITNGIGENRFGTGQSILRQDIVVMLYHIYEKNTENPLNEAVQRFSDYDAISYYARTAVSSFYTLSIINGKEDQRFAPMDYVTRAEAAKMIYNTLTLMRGGI